MRESIDNAVPSTRPDPAAMYIAEQAFRQTYPTFDSTSSLDELRAREYARLDDMLAWTNWTMSTWTTPEVGYTPRASSASTLNCCAAACLAILTRSVLPPAPRPD